MSLNLRDAVEEIRETAANGLAYAEDRGELRLRLVRVVEMSALALDRVADVPPVTPEPTKDFALRYQERDQDGYDVPRFLYFVAGKFYGGKIRAIKARREYQVPTPTLLDAKNYVDGLEDNAKEVI